MVCSHQNQRLQELEHVLQEMIDSILTGSICYPPIENNNVAVFMNMLYKKHLTEYTKQVVKWIEYVVGKNWRTFTPSELRVKLNDWIECEMKKNEDLIHLENRATHLIERPRRRHARLTVLGVREEIGEMVSDRSVNL